MKSKGWHEEFARFFETPSREALRDLLRGHVGELNCYDFKGTWPTYPKVARHILGLANSSGGCLILGVEEKEDKTFEPVGVDMLRDKADIYKGIQKFISGQLKHEILDFSYDASEYPKMVGKKFQVLIVEDTPRYIPFVAMSDGDGIRKNAIYVRHGTSSEEANYEELQDMFNRRIETEYSSKYEFDLSKHLSELNILYRNIPRFYEPSDYMVEMMQRDFNPSYPPIPSPITHG
jgi:predicted HTH transcriptional regulator